MKSLIRWAINNAPTMNTLMLGVIVLGIVGLWQLRREVFPEFELEIIMITVPYPGASPEEVEEGICQKIEEAVQAISGIKKVNSVAMEGTGSVVLELHAYVRDVQRVLNEVRAEVDRIPSLPELAEDPIIKQITLRRGVIRVGVLGPETNDPDAEFKLREVAERVRDELLELPSISLAEVIGAREYQIDVELSEKTLRQYGLSLQKVAQIIRQENLELPGGTLRAESQEVILRGKNKFFTGPEIAKLPLVTQPNGVVLTVGDLGQVRDHFVDTTASTRINRRPGLVISIDKTASEDLLAMAREVREFVAKINQPDGFQLPPGYEVTTWADISVLVAQRLELLTRNGIQGLIIVFVLLTLFLNFKLAFWVAVGLPVAIFGTMGMMYLRGDTLNMMSMFAFLVALGILVDDGIVIGENIYTHRRMGKSRAQAALDGTYEVLPSVINSVSTTIVAFMPLMFVPGLIGKFIAIFPVAVITMLVMSLIEATFILPCHLGHESPRRNQSRTRGWVELWNRLPVPIAGLLFAASLGGILALLIVRPGLPWQAASFPEAIPLLAAYAGLVPAVIIVVTQLLALWPALEKGLERVNEAMDRTLALFIHRSYLPTLRWALDNPTTVFAIAASVVLMIAGLIAGGIIKFNAFPKLDANNLAATVIFPDGTPASVTEAATRRLEDAIWEINDQLSKPGRPLIRVTHRSVGPTNVLGEMGPQLSADGSHSGAVAVEIVDLAERDVTSEEIIRMWREKVGAIPGVESLTYRAEARGPGGLPIEFKLLAVPAQMAALEQAVEACKAKLSEYKGVFDITDDCRSGKWEFQIRIKDYAKALGVRLADVAATLRAAYYGEEVMRLQRGRHEVKLMVRYPEEERRSLAMLNEIRIRTADGIERPLPELADIQLQRGYSRILRLDQRRAITVTADVDEAQANAQEIVNDFQRNFLTPLLARPEFQGIRARWEGMQEQTAESIRGMIYGLLIALVAMFALLTVEFRSYAQPLMVLAIIPLGLVGAVFGHLALGYEVSLLSLFGMVALTGVVVNDSIVLIDFINHRLAAGLSIREALLDAGRRRVRPVLLTSLTTIGGLSPLILERSLQAQFLIPMAVSLCFGLLFTTVLVLFFVPVLYLTYHKMLAGKADSEMPPPEALPEWPAPEQREEPAEVLTHP